MADKPATMSADTKRENEYRAKDDARTLMDAAAVHGDGQRRIGARKHLKHAMRALRSLGSRK